MKKLMMVTIAALGFAACGQQKAEDAVQKVLVLYYSQNGITKQVAEEMQRQLNENAAEICADIVAIEAVNPYDGDFNQTIERCQNEMAEGIVPQLKPLNVNIDDYDVVFLGYPIWFGTYASPIAALVDQYKFEGKKVITFCTFGSGGLQSSTNALKAALPDAEVVEGYGVREARIAKMPNELLDFLVRQGFGEGTLEAPVTFGEHHAVSDDEVVVFNEACGDYFMPLGTPVDVAVEMTCHSTEYEFTAASQTPSGQPANATIYVTKETAEGSKAEFIQVVR